jgi:two-component system cell cycle response regulator DivK
MQTHALVIDDNLQNVNVLVNMLTDEGVTSTPVMNPRQLDAVISSLQRVDVVFLDLEMPTLDGYEVLANLRSDSRFASIPVIAYTVHVSEIVTASRAGFDGFLGKPIDPDRFPTQLARILRGEPVWEAG